MSRWGDNPMVRVKRSSIHGRGLFAATGIEKDTYIGTYEGPATRKNGMHVLWIWDEDDNDWVGINGRNQLRFLNHADDPNAEFEGVDLYALRDIAEGEEITFDYQW